MGFKESASQEQAVLEPQSSGKPADRFDLVISDECLRQRIRAVVEEKPKPSWLQRISHNPLMSVLVGFVLTGLFGTGVTLFYTQRQQKLAAQRSFSDELNKIRIQKIGEVWERLDEDELVIDSLLEEAVEEPTKGSEGNDQKVDEIRKLIHADRVQLTKNRFWLGEVAYNKTVDYLNSSIAYAVNQIMYGRETDVSHLKKKRDSAKQDILQIRELFLKGDTGLK